LAGLAHPALAGGGLARSPMGEHCACWPISLALRLQPGHRQKG
jgi:hypothetical protein